MTADEIADPQALQLWLEVDGKRYQAGSTATMIFSVKEIISYLSRFMCLLPGDIIAPGGGDGAKTAAGLLVGRPAAAVGR